MSIKLPKSNLPQLEKLAEKTKSEISELESVLKDKNKELEFLETAILNLKGLEQMNAPEKKQQETSTMIDMGMFS